MADDRYRHAEQRLWEHAGVQPVEHRVRLVRNQVDVRIQEAGTGPPILFLHGGPGASGAIWADLVARLPGFRCLALDRPGTGLSDPNRLADAAAVRQECATLVADVLDALELDRAHLVGSSHGSYAALLSAAAHPDRVDRTVHLGCPGFVEGMVVRATDRIVLMPGARVLFGLFRPSERAVLNAFRQLGHEATVSAGDLPQPFVEWAVALQRHTDTMANELATMANMGSFRRGFDPTLTIESHLLATVRSPTRFLWGSADPYGGESVARRLADAMPDAQLEMMPGAGHLCWLDDVDHAAAVISDHLARAPVAAAGD